MKQVKRLILSAFLVVMLSAGAQAGDIGSPGIKSTPPGDIGSPGVKVTKDINGAGAITTTELIDGTSDPVMLEILLALIALI